MQAADFIFLCELVKRRSGLVLTPAKMHLAKSRLLPVARRFGFKRVDQLVRELRYGSEPLVRAVTEAMTINESFFFRDSSAFENFEEIVLPALLLRRAADKRFRIWCAACAMGQEAYSLAMILDDHRLKERGWNIEIVATDINSDSIARAREGLYAQFEIKRGLPLRRIVGHFMQEGEYWRISDRLRRAVDFRPFNLLDSYGWSGAFDVIFCRNVLMYFDAETKSDVLNRLYPVLAADGYLVLGQTETTSGFTPRYAETAPGLFQRYQPQMRPRLSLAASA
jgi:chemotaxis protein methyltransferase CheR